MQKWTAAELFSRVEDTRAEVLGSIELHHPESLHKPFFAELFASAARSTTRLTSNASAAMASVSLMSSLANNSGARARSTSWTWAAISNDWFRCPEMSNSANTSRVGEGERNSK